MPKSKHLNNIFNIKSNYSFLPSLVAWIWEEYPDPFYLANITILLPSRRACREIKKCFLQAAENQAMILPKILAIGDVDYDDVYYPPLEGGSNQLAGLGRGKKFIQANRFYSSQTLLRAKELRQNHTNAENLLWYYLRNKRLDNYKFRRQQAVGKYIVDFVCLEKKLIIELDGGQHGEDKNIKYDAKRDQFLKDSGFKILRFWNDEVFKNCLEVLDVILFELRQCCQIQHSYPSQNLARQDFTLPQGEGNKIEYQLRLIQEIRNWNQKTNLFGKDISSAALAEIADNLQGFLDEVEKEGLDLEGLLAVDDGELASHKQQILQFLQYFGSVWQNVLVKDGLASAAKNRNLMLKNYSDDLLVNGSKYPIIAAGSTGSVIAAAELLKTIAWLENGRVVLFGLDKDLNEEIWQKIVENHPQFMLKKLLERMEVSRRDVVEIANVKQSDDLVVNLCSLAALPAEFIFDKQLAVKDQVNSITKIETENEFDEAKIIALLFRQALETKGKTAALISNDKNLIELVRVNLLAWQVEIDDSASSNLAESELVNYLFLISEFAKNDFSAVNLLAVLKHSLTNFNSEFLRVLEMGVFRDVVKFFGFDDLILWVENNDDLVVWLVEIAEIFKPLIGEFEKEEVDFVKMVGVHFDCFEKLIHTHFHPRESGDDKAGGGEEFLEFYQEISATKSNFSLEPQSYNQLLKNLLKNYQFRKSGQFHPRLHILSTMEARLMSYDLTIVVGLCEGEFPAKVSDDWLGNKIRAEFGLSSGAKKIGISAYDFCNYLANKEVVLLYPKNQNNAPTIKSRFLLKLETVLKLNGWESWLKNGQQYLQLLVLDDKKRVNISRANPKPKHNLQKISATDISKWLRNPYYIYAKRILQLKPLQQIEQDASFREFGNFVHKALEEFVKNYPQIDLKDYGEKIFANYFPDPTSRLLWWAKFENIVKWFLKQEEELRNNSQVNFLASFVEIEAEITIKDIILTTKIDRINLYRDGSFEIIDYKTGALPQAKEIKSGLEPQLAVEALILTKGKIKNCSEIKLEKISNLQYQNLKGRDQNEVKDLADIDKLIAAADDGILRLLEIFVDQNIGYICCPNIDIYKEDDYWHLGRVGEL